jgi:hypothetical protein
VTALTDKLKVDVADARERDSQDQEFHNLYGTPEYDRRSVLTTLNTALAVIEAQEELVEASQGIRKALHQWLMDHSDRCRICTDKSTQAIKAASNAAMRLNHVITAALVYGDRYTRSRELLKG